MDQLLVQYLILYKNLYFPHIGIFTIEQKSANYQSDTGLLEPDAQFIQFSEGVERVSDQHFFDYLSLQLQQDQVVVIRAFHDYCYAIRKSLVEKGQYYWKGVGYLTKQADQSIQFEMLNPPFELFEPLQLPFEDSLAMNTHKDKWWLWALLLLLLGLAALLFQIIP